MSELRDEERKYWEEKIKLDARRNIYMAFTMIFTCITAIGAIACLFL